MESFEYLRNNVPFNYPEKYFDIFADLDDTLETCSMLRETFGNCSLQL
jgi:hypothetical protein